MGVVFVVDAVTPADIADAVRAELAPELGRLDVAVSASSTSTVTALSAALTAIAQQITDLAAAGVDDATLTQLTAARDQLQTAIDQLDTSGPVVYEGGVS